MTITVEALEAKTHFSNLLDKAAAGEQVVITRNGKPVAHLVAAAPAIDRQKVDAAVATLRRLRQGNTLGGLNWRDLRDEGRK